jgi:hypothetical protein
MTRQDCDRCCNSDHSAVSILLHRRSGNWSCGYQLARVGQHDEEPLAVWFDGEVGGETSTYCTLQYTTPTAVPYTTRITATTQTSTSVFRGGREFHDDRHINDDCAGGEWCLPPEDGSSNGGSGGSGGGNGGLSTGDKIALGGGFRMGFWRLVPFLRRCGSSICVELRNNLEKCYQGGLFFWLRC